MRLASSRSSIRRTRWASCRSTMARASRSASLPAGATFMIAIALLIGASGLRSSCASIATNSSLRRAATAQRIGLALALGDVDRGRDQEAPAVGVAARGPGEEVPGPELAARHPKLALAAVDPPLRAEQRADRRHDGRLPLAVGPARPLLDGRHLVRGVAGVLDEGLVDEQHLAVLGVEQRRRPHLHQRMPQPRLGAAHRRFGVRLPGDVAEHQDAAVDALPSWPRIGAALSSIGWSTP